MPPEPLPSAAAPRASALGTDALGPDDSALAAGTERSLGAIDAAMRARGYRFTLCINRSPYGEKQPRL